jgi:phosphatidylglycerophosphate synthase
VLNKKIWPWSLLYFRLLAGPVIIYFSLEINHPHIIILIMIWAGLISDIFDGIIARHLGVATRFLRIMDGWVDIVFWLCSAISLFILYPLLWQENKILLVIFFIQEPVSDIINLIKFKKQGCAHNWTSKLFGLFLLTAFSVILCGGSFIFFKVSLLMGLISQWDRMVISYLLPAAECDIPSFYHAWLRKNGKTFKRYKMLN